MQISPFVGLGGAFTTVAKYFGGNNSWWDISLSLLVWRGILRNPALRQWLNILVGIFLGRIFLQPVGLEGHLKEPGIATVTKYFGGNISWKNISLLP